MYRLRDPKMCSQTKFGIPRIYACDTIFQDPVAVVKVVTLHDSNALRHEFWQNNIGDILWISYEHSNT